MIEGENQAIFDPAFSICFINKKSRERVEELVSHIKSECSEQESPRVNIVGAVIEKLENKPEEMVKYHKAHIGNGNLQINQINQISVAPLKPFMFPTYPAAQPARIQKNKSDLFMEVKHNFLIESRTEHQRLIHTFRDRLMKEICEAEDSYYPTPFMDTIERLYCQDNISNIIPEKRKETIQAKMNKLIRRSQKQTHDILEVQKRNSKLLNEEEIFHRSLKNKNQTTDSTSSAVPVLFPYSFLNENNV